MMIILDLDELTPEKVREALPHLGECRYAAPCIIGTLVPPEHRQALDDYLLEGLQGQWNIGQIAETGGVRFKTEEQKRIAETLQEAFDYRDKDRFLRILETELGIVL